MYSDLSREIDISLPCAADAYAHLNVYPSPVVLAGYALGALQATAGEVKHQNILYRQKSFHLQIQATYCCAQVRASDPKCARTIVYSLQLLNCMKVNLPLKGTLDFLCFVVSCSKGFVMIMNWTGFIFIFQLSL